MLICDNMTHLSHAGRRLESAWTSLESFQDIGYVEILYAFVKIMLYVRLLRKYL